jgi:hypothetical protein
MILKGKTKNKTPIVITVNGHDEVRKADLFLKAINKKTKWIV